MKKNTVLKAVCKAARLPAVLLLAFMVLAGCKDPNGGGGDGETLLEVTHVNGFQGSLSNGTLIEIAVETFANGNQSFTLYVGGVPSGTGTLTLSGGSITGIVSCTNSSLTYSGGVRYSGNAIPMRRADGTVWVHWGTYYGATMSDFNAHAQQYGGNAQLMYTYRPAPNDQGIYSYDTPQNIYNQARQDHPSDAPPISVLNQAIRVLNDHKNTGVGAYVSNGNLIAYYFRRVN